MGRYLPALRGKSALNDPETVEEIAKIFISQKWRHTPVTGSEHYFELGNRVSDFFITDTFLELFIPRNARRGIRYCVVALVVKDNVFSLSLVKGAANEHSDYTLLDSAFTKEALNTVSEAKWVLQSASTNSYSFDTHSFNHPKEFKNRMK